MRSQVHWTQGNLNLLLRMGRHFIKVRNPEKYFFNPKVLLGRLTDIYLHLYSEKFIAAVARDGRSYNRAIFDKAIQIMDKNAIKSSPDLQRLAAFVDACESAMASTQKESIEMGDVPDEFLDPVLFHVMEDPVILPSSKITIDRATIVAHLLNDKNDPFNRQPLALKDVVPSTHEYTNAGANVIVILCHVDVELKKKIEEFKKERGIK